MRLRVFEDEPGWGRADSLVRRDLPMFWLAVTLFVAGAACLQALVGPVVSLYPGAASLMVIVWGLYALPFVALIVLLDLHEPEPPSLLAAAAGWGALVAVPIAYVANTSLDSILTKRIDDEVAARWYPALSGPWTEELLKGLGLVVLVSLAARQLTTVLDGMVYGAFIGLGFQVAENLIATAQAVRTPHAGTGESVVVQALLVRGLGLGMWSHAAWTALVGAGVAFVLIRRRAATGSSLVSWLVLGGSLVAATSLHFVWNAPWWQPDTHSFDAGTMLTYAAKGLPAAVLVVTLAVAARNREVAWFATALQDRPEVEQHEVEILRTWVGRRSARRAAAASGGRFGRRAARRLHAAQVRLAVAVATQRPRHEVEAAGQRVRFARAVLSRTTGPGQVRATR
jgi:RsiW-degrading membrane proteinase PrsW (M82 family)